ncbi:MAG: arylsulfatase [Verrucomicrobiota bacterium]
MITKRAGIFLTVYLLVVSAAAAATRPNIVMILADDLGWGDPRCYQAESKIPTPAMDRLAVEGLRFTDAHTSSSVCTPTRYSLLTGRYAWRTRLKEGVLDGFDPPLIAADEDTIASLLKRAGYETHCIGKWHLGMQWMDKDGYVVGDRDVAGGFRSGRDVDFAKSLYGGPVDVGFDHYFGISASLDMSPYCWIEERRVVDLPELESPENRDGLYMNQVEGVMSEGFALVDVLPRIAQKTADVIQAARDGEAPFFCYVPLTSPHLPVVPTLEATGKSEAGAYGDFVVATDQALATILEALDESGQTDDTLVIFSSDNGGLFHSWRFRADDDGGKAPKSKRGEETAKFGHQSNAHWRGTKADIYEGGHRVPFLVRWPAGAPAGRVVDALVELTDLYATVADLVGQSGQGTSGMDSFSLLSLITGETTESPRPFAVHHSLAGLFALRKGDWKFIEGRGSGGFTRPRHIPGEERTGQLYHLGEDDQERVNRYGEESDLVLELRETLDRVRESGAVAATEGS